MKKIKSILSVILSAVIIFTLALPAFAADSGVQTLEAVNATMKIGENTTIKIKTEKAGIYFIDLYSARGAFIAVNVENGEDELFSGVIPTSDKMLYITGDEQFFKADADTELTVYLFDIDLLASDKSDYNVKVTPVYCGNNVLAAGENKAESEVSVFSFIPEEDGYYSFESNAPKSIDPQISIAGGLFYPERNYDNGLDGDKNFSLTSYLEKGQEYLVAVTSFADSDGEFTPFNFTVSINKKFDIKKVSLDCYENGETIKEYRGVEDTLVVSLAPTGALYDLSEVTVSAENEKIASIDVDDFGYISVHPHRLGKTTLTITGANGCEAQYTIKVRPHIFWLFSRFFNFISSLLDR